MYGSLALPHHLIFRRFKDQPAVEDVHLPADGHPGTLQQCLGQIRLAEPGNPNAARIVGYGGFRGPQPAASPPAFRLDFHDIADDRAFLSVLQFGNLHRAGEVRMPSGEEVKQIADSFDIQPGQLGCPPGIHAGQGCDRRVQFNLGGRRLVRLAGPGATFRGRGLWPGFFPCRRSLSGIRKFEAVAGQEAQPRVHPRRAVRCVHAGITGAYQLSAGRGSIDQGSHGLGPAANKAVHAADDGLVVVPVGPFQFQDVAEGLGPVHCFR